MNETYAHYSNSPNISRKNHKNLLPTLPFGRGMVMWFILLMGYFLFITAWFSAGYTKGSGSSGWSHYFFGQDVNSITAQAVNYGITLARGIGSFLIGYLIVKLTHRYAAILALTLLSMSVLSVVSSYAIASQDQTTHKYGEAAYSLFIIFRLLMAVGATTLIVLLQPVVAKSVRSNRQKAIISSINPFGFNTGFVVMTLIFVFPQASTFLNTGSNWFYFSLGFSLLTLIPLFAYSLLGLNFDISQAADSQHKEIYTTGKKQTTLFSVLKEKNTIAWVVVYALWLVAAVMPILGTNGKAANALADNTFKNAITHTLLTQPSQWVRPWAILFVGGIVVGAFTVGRFSKTNFQRKPYMVAITALGAAFYIISVVNNLLGLPVFYLIFGFLFGILTWGIQGPLLNNPYELPNASPRRVGLFFGIIWGLGYMGFTFVNIILAAIVDVSPIAYYVVLTILIATLPVSILFTKESKPQGLVRFNPFARS